jgi:hypothetical protein
LDASLQKFRWLRPRCRELLRCVSRGALRNEATDQPPFFYVVLFSLSFNFFPSRLPINPVLRPLVPVLAFRRVRRCPFEAIFSDAYYGTASRICISAHWSLLPFKGKLAVSYFLRQAGRRLRRRSLLVSASCQIQRSLRAKMKNCSKAAFDLSLMSVQATAKGRLTSGG